MPRKHPIERQAGAIAIAALTSPAEAERQTGIPSSTIRTWTEQMPEQVNALLMQRRMTIASNLLAAIEAGTQATATALEALRDGPPLTSPRDIQAVATATAICLDKLHALDGRAPTSARFGSDDLQPLAPELLERKAFYLEHIRRSQLPPKS